MNVKQCFNQTKDKNDEGIEAHHIHSIEIISLDVWFKIGMRFYVCSDNGVGIDYFELEALMRIGTNEETKSTCGRKRLIDLTQWQKIWENWMKKLE